MCITCSPLLTGLPFPHLSLQCCFSPSRSLLLIVVTTATLPTVNNSTVTLYPIVTAELLLFLVARVGIPSPCPNVHSIAFPYTYLPPLRSYNVYFKSSCGQPIHCCTTLFAFASVSAVVVVQRATHMPVPSLLSGKHFWPCIYSNVMLEETVLLTFFEHPQPRTLF